MESTSHMENSNSSACASYHSYSINVHMGCLFSQLFCSFCATFSLNFFMSVSQGNRIGHIQLGFPGLVNFGTFGTVIYIILSTTNACLISHCVCVLLYCLQEEGTLWNAYHLIIFLIMGVVGGLLGALFNSLNITLSEYRMKYLHRRKRIWQYVNHQI